MEFVIDDPCWRYSEEQNTGISHIKVDIRNWNVLMWIAWAKYLGFTVKALAILIGSGWFFLTTGGSLLFSNKEMWDKWNVEQRHWH